MSNEKSKAITYVKEIWYSSSIILQALSFATGNASGEWREDIVIDMKPQSHRCAKASPVIRRM